jgi:hypothetical protein
MCDVLDSIPRTIKIKNRNKEGDMWTLRQTCIKQKDAKGHRERAM